MIKDLKSSNTGETINPNIVSENIPTGAVTTEKLEDGSVSYGKLATALKNLIDGKASASDLTEVQNALTSHTGNTSNPHSVTKSQVGLGNVDNTSDANKPISTATQTALDLKADKSNIPFENIKDVSGHNRFVEANITTPTFTQNFEFTYAKWSLSGTHLMIVLAGNGASSADFAIGEFAVTITNMPEWIMNKIIPSGVLVTLASATGRETGIRFLSEKFSLTKPHSDELTITNEEAINVSNNYSFRLQFDLIIDNA